MAYAEHMANAEEIHPLQLHSTLPQESLQNNVTFLPGMGSAVKSPVWQEPKP